MALTKEQRDALPDSDFAVPETRDLPMHDEKHVRMAWDMVERTKGLSEAQRQSARHRILERAKKLGMDTASWKTVKAVAIEAMSLELPPDPGHPNRMPFSGILVRLDRPSDKPPEGADGKRIVMTRAAAEAGLKSLLGMGVDLTDRLDGHDPQKKIGIITAATIKGDAVAIEGFIYASDFPDAAACIRATKANLGFSFEGKATVADPQADPLVITECVFTGAAILEKSKAAYMSTKLAAHAVEEDISMTKEELAAMLEPLTAKVGDLENKLSAATDISASRALLAKVEPHCAALEAAADNMEKDGIGTHPSHGHVHHLRAMARHLRAEAAQGRIPSIYETGDFLHAAAADPDPALVQLKADVAALSTTIKDLSAKAFNTAKEPDRKTLSPEVQTLLAKAGIDGNGEKKISAAAVDTALDAAGVTDSAKRIAAKLKLQKDGLLGA